MTMPDTGPSKASDAPVLLDLADEAATEALAGKVAAAARRGDVIALWGDLGSGKTVFARAFINARAGNPEEVPSPTYTLVQTYEVPENGGTVLVYHFDLFRIEEPEEILELGLDEARSGGIALIEWPDRLGPLLPADRLDISLNPGKKPDARQAAINGFGGWVNRFEDLVE